MDWRARKASRGLHALRSSQQIGGRLEPGRSGLKPAIAPAAHGREGRVEEASGTASRFSGVAGGRMLADREGRGGRSAPSSGQKAIPEDSARLLSAIRAP